MLVSLTHKRFFNPSQKKLVKLASSLRWKSTKLANLLNNVKEPPMLHYNQYLKKVDEPGDYVIGERYADLMDQLTLDDQNRAFAKIALSTPSILTSHDKTSTKPRHNSEVTRDTKDEPVPGCSINSSKFKNINSKTRVEQIDYSSDPKNLEDTNKNYKNLNQHQNRIPSMERRKLSLLDIESQILLQSPPK